MVYWFKLKPLIPKSNDAQTKVELKIPQLTKIDQLSRQETINMRREHYSPRVENLIPVGGNFFAEFILL